MDDYLERRGQRVEALFGFRRDRTLALIPSAVFFEHVELETDDDVVRCRLGGMPAALLRVTDELHLDVAHLALEWPRWMAELVERVGEDDAFAMASLPALVEPLRDGDEDRLKDLILEHQIRAEDLHVLGEGSPHRAPRALERHPRFELRFPRGTLELAYTRDAFEGAQDDRENVFAAPELAVEVRWNGARIALPRKADLPWHESELAEVLVVATTMVDAQPRRVADLFEALFSDEPPGDALVTASILNLWGVALRKVDDLDGAIAKLTEALPLAEKADPKLEQQVAYNLGYAKLQTTMKDRHRVGSQGGTGLYTAHYEVDERHRATWTECLALFERALALDPSDPTAIAQVDQTKKLLAILSGNAGGSGARRTHGPRAAPEKGLPEWLVPAGLVLILVVALVGFAQWKKSDRQDLYDPRPAADVPAPREPSARELSDMARSAIFDRFDPEALPSAGADPCPITFPPPREVPAGEVVAPYLGRGIGTGELYGTEHFDATIRQYALVYAPDVEVRPASREGIGPLTGEGASTSRSTWSYSPHRLTVLVTGWRDPIILESGAWLSPGRVEARLFVWSYEGSRFVCTGDVEAENRPGLSIARASAYDPVQEEDDPLNRARLDLIEQALRLGIPRLVATAPSAAPDAGAPR